jgi:hypothetical protein
LIEAIAGRPAKSSAAKGPPLSGGSIGSGVHSRPLMNARRNRLHVKEVLFFWIEEMLWHSHYEVARRELGFIEKSDAVEQPFEMVLQWPYEQP